MTLPNGQNSYYQGFTIATRTVQYQWTPRPQRLQRARVTPFEVVGEMSYYEGRVRGIEGGKGVMVVNYGRVVKFRGSGWVRVVLSEGPRRWVEWVRVKEAMKMGAQERGKVSRKEIKIVEVKAGGYDRVKVLFEDIRGINITGDMVSISFVEDP